MSELVEQETSGVISDVDQIQENEHNNDVNQYQDQEVVAASSSTQGNIISVDPVEIEESMRKMGLEIMDPIGCDHDGTCMCEGLEEYFKTL